jgi:hypothetical protein
MARMTLSVFPLMRAFWRASARLFAKTEPTYVFLGQRDRDVLDGLHRGLARGVWMCWPQIFDILVIHFTSIDQQADINKDPG